MALRTVANAAIPLQATNASPQAAQLLAQAGAANANAAVRNNAALAQQRAQAAYDAQQAAAQQAAAVAAATPVAAAAAPAAAPAAQQRTASRTATRGLNVFGRNSR